MMPIENLRELSERLISCKHFKWMPGMLAIRIYNERKILTRLVEKDCEVMIAEPSLTGNLESGHIDLYSWNNKKDLYLDLEDPATIGCLINLVRIAWNGRAVISMGNGWWSVEADSDNDGFYSDQDCSSSFNESLVLAFDAANE
jgi:hypothetical protein